MGKRKLLMRQQAFTDAVANAAEAVALAVESGSSQKGMTPLVFLQLQDLMKMMTTKGRRIPQKKMRRSKDPELLCYLSW